MAASCSDWVADDNDVNEHGVHNLVYCFDIINTDVFVWLNKKPVSTVAQQRSAMAVCLSVQCKVLL